MALTDYVVDTSVFTRAGSPAVAGRMNRLAAEGRLSICAVVAAELLRGARSAQHHQRLAEQLRMIYSIPTPDEVWDRLLAVQSQLATQDQHQQVKVPDLLIAAVAERNRVSVLHYDADFDLISAVTGQDCEWVVPRGSVS